MMTVTYIYHSCYTVETDKTLLVFDYWKDPDGLLHRMLDVTEKQVYFFVSHFHEDHYNPEILEMEGRRIISYDAKKRRRIPDDKATAVMHMDETYADEFLQAKAYKSTDVGVCYLVEADGEKVFHAGDYNNWYFSGGDEHLKVSVREMEGLFMATLRKIKADAPRIGHVMFPMDPRLGEDTLRGPKQWLKTIETLNFYPMHTWEQDISQYLAELQSYTSATIHSL